MTDASRLPTVSVVIPVHNEADYLDEALPRLFAELDGVPADVQVLLAENGSTDGTPEAVTRLQGDYPRLSMIMLPDADYGAAMREGLLASQGTWRVNFDIDYFSGAFLNEVLALEDVADMVLASKLAPGAEDRRPRFRRVATRAFNWILRLLFRSRVSDTHGMKAIRAEVVASLADRVRSTRDLFDTELVLRAERAGFRIVEVPTVVEEVRVTKQGFLKRVPRTLVGLALIRWRFWREARSARSPPRGTGPASGPSPRE